MEWVEWGGVVYRLCCYDEVGSTNDVAKALARTYGSHPLIVWALTQTHGRGRRGRVWYSPFGNLYVSFVMTGGCVVDGVNYNAHQRIKGYMSESDTGLLLSLMAALAIGDVIRPLLAVPSLLSYKWPNDVLVAGKKIAGVLIERSMPFSSIDSISMSPESDMPTTVIGVGINVAAAPVQDVGYPVTDLVHECLDVPSLSTLLEHVVRALHKWQCRYDLEGSEVVCAAWSAYAYGIGLPITVQIGGALQTGLYAGIDREGRLLMRQQTGHDVVVASVMGLEWCMKYS